MCMCVCEGVVSVAGNLPLTSVIDPGLKFALISDSMCRATAFFRAHGANVCSWKGA